MHRKLSQQGFTSADCSKGQRPYQFHYLPCSWRFPPWPQSQATRAAVNAVWQTIQSFTPLFCLFTRALHSTAIKAHQDHTRVNGSRRRSLFRSKKYQGLMQRIKTEWVLALSFLSRFNVSFSFPPTTSAPFSAIKTVKKHMVKVPDFIRKLCSERHFVYIL